MFRGSLAVAAALVLVACSTPYQPAGFRGGYSETTLAADQVIVRFRGNGYTSGERAYDFALYRAAELTLQHGYERFIIGQGNDSVSTGYYVSGSQYGTSYNATAIPINRHTVVLSVHFFKSDSAPSDSLDARTVEASVAGKWGLKE